MLLELKVGSQVDVWGGAEIDHQIVPIFVGIGMVSRIRWLRLKLTNLSCLQVDDVHIRHLVLDPLEQLKNVEATLKHFWSVNGDWVVEEDGKVFGDGKTVN